METLYLGDRMKMNFIEELDSQLRVKESFDLVKRQLKIKDKYVYYYFIDGYIKDDLIERIMEFQLTTKHLSHNLIDIMDTLVPYVEVEVVEDINKIMTAILSGTVALVVEGISGAILIDARTYPTRSMSEPEDDRVLRGSRDGFVETLVFNTALIRRRIRDPRLTMHYMSIGSVSQSDIVICYMEGVADKKLVDNILTKFKEIEVEALTMSQESLAEALVKGKWYSPFPKVRYTERPDSASSNVLEGKIVVIIDNSPSVMILPTYFFDFVQEAQDYYLPPITGTYLRIVRVIVMLVTLLITPVWYFFNSNPNLCPTWLLFSLIPIQQNLPIILQLLILEFGIDALKLASLNTPSALNGSFSIIGALILGDFAVSAGWFNSEVILYMAFVALANFTQPSYELGYAIKFMRVMLLLLIAIFPQYGLGLGLICIGVILYQSKTILKDSYLYPLIPFCWKDFKMIFRRHKLTTRKHK